MYLGGGVGVEVDALAPADGEKGPFLARFSPHVSGTGVVGWVGRVGEVHRRRARLGLGQQRGQRVGQEGSLRRRVGLAGHGRGQFVEEPQPVQAVGQARNGVAHPVCGGQPVGKLAAVGVEHTANFGPQFRRLGIGEQAGVAHALGHQHRCQTLLPVGLGAAAHARPVQAQIFRRWPPPPGRSRAGAAPSPARTPPAPSRRVALAEAVPVRYRTAQRSRHSIEPV